MNTSYWRDATHDEAMQEEHEFIWRAMLETIDVDLTGNLVLDAGCNRGGFLRLLADEQGIAEGYGYDPATAAIADARRLANGRPLHFRSSSSVPEGWTGMDVAFSHEVIYLLPDLPSHAAAIHQALKPGGVYFVAMGVHAGSALMVEWHATNRDELQLPPLRTVDEVIETFQQEGFEASIARLAISFVPVDGAHHDHARSLEWLDYYHDEKILMRFAGVPSS